MNEFIPKNNLLKTIKALTEAFVSEIDEEFNPHIIEKSSNFIIHEYENMQFILKVIIFLLINYLNLIQIFKYGKPFASLPLKIRIKILTNWMGSKLSIKRDAAKLLLSLSILSYYDNPEVLKRLGINIDKYLSIAGFYNTQAD